MARKHADNVDAAIRSYVRAGMNGRQIREALAAGSELLEPVSMPLRTVQDKAAKHRRQWESERDPLEGMDEIEAVDAIFRDFIREATKATKRYRETARKRDLTPKEANAMRDWTKTLSEIRRHFARTRGTDSNQKKRAGEQRGRTPETTTLARLSSRLEPASPNPPGANASQSTPEADHNGRDAGEDRSTNRSDESAPHSVSDARSLEPAIHA